MSRDSRDVAGRGSDYDETGLHVHVERGDDKDRNVIIRAQRYPQARLTVMLAVMAVAALAVLLLSQPRPAQLDRLDDRPGAAGQTTTAVTSTTYLPLVMRRYSNLPEWSQLAGNAQRTSFYPVDIPTPWRVQWIWNGPAGGGDGGPAAGHLRLPRAVQVVTGNGRLYVGHSDGVIRAISEDTGQTVWATPVGGQLLNTAAYDAATNSVYIGSTNGHLYRLSASGGQVLGDFNAGGQIYMAPLLVGNSIYIGSTTGNFYALNKSTLLIEWTYPAGGALYGSPAYSASNGGIVILLAEDISVHAVRVSDGTRLWRTGTPTIGADRDQYGMNLAFLDTYPVVAEQSGVVIVRTYRSQWPGTVMNGPNNTAPSTVAEIRTYLTQNPSKQSLFVLDLATGAKRYVAPVGVGGIGDGIWTVGPQVVIKPLDPTGEVAYLLWRSYQACQALGGNNCDARDDSTLGEMDLASGDIRFVQDHRNQGTLRLHTDEQSPLSMAGNQIMHAHWMTLAPLRITNRATSYGTTYANPIQTVELSPATNTIRTGGCSSRNNHFCSQLNFPPCDGYGNDPAFYIYYAATCAYDDWWHVGESGSPVRSAAISNNSIYWKTVDGAIMALTSGSP